MPLDPSRVEPELTRLCNLLEERAGDYSTAVTRAAVADATFRRHYAQAMLAVIDASDGKRMTVQEREARVDLSCADEYAAKAMTEATSKSVRAAMDAIRVQIDVARTIAATVRQLTGPN